MTAIVHALERFFAGLPLPLLEGWGLFAYVVGLALAVIVERVLGRPRSLMAAQVRTTVGPGIVSAFMNNTPVVALLGSQNPVLFAPSGTGHTVLQPPHSASSPETGNSTPLSSQPVVVQVIVQRSGAVSVVIVLLRACVAKIDDRTGRAARATDCLGCSGR